MGPTAAPPRDMVPWGAGGEPLLRGVWFHQGRMQGSVESKGLAWYSAHCPPPLQRTAYQDSWTAHSLEVRALNSSAEGVDGDPGTNYGSVRCQGLGPKYSHFNTLPCLRALALSGTSFQKKENNLQEPLANRRHRMKEPTLAKCVLINTQMFRTESSSKLFWGFQDPDPL